MLTFSFLMEYLRIFNEFAVSSSSCAYLSIYVSAIKGLQLLWASSLSTVLSVRSIEVRHRTSIFKYWGRLTFSRLGPPLLDRWASTIFWMFCRFWLWNIRTSQSISMKPMFRAFTTFSSFRSIGSIMLKSWNILRYAKELSTAVFLKNGPTASLDGLNVPPDVLRVIFSCRASVLNIPTRWTIACERWSFIFMYPFLTLLLSVGSKDFLKATKASCTALMDS